MKCFQLMLNKTKTYVSFYSYYKKNEPTPQSGVKSGTFESVTALPSVEFHILHLEEWNLLCSDRLSLRFESRRSANVSLSEERIKRGTLVLSFWSEFIYFLLEVAMICSRSCCEDLLRSTGKGPKKRAELNKETITGEKRMTPSRAPEKLLADVKTSS